MQSFSKKNLLLILFLIFLIVLFLVFLFIFQNRKKEVEIVDPLSDLVINEEQIIEELVNAKIPEETTLQDENEIIENLVNVSPVMPEGEILRTEERGFRIAHKFKP